MKDNIYAFFISRDEFCKWTYIHKTDYCFVIHKESWLTKYLKIFMDMWKP